jgi:holo-[acyl-carrier protein] synthase
MILSLGIGYVDVPRFEAAERRHGERLQRRLFTAGERAYAARRARGSESLAVRFAAKLAAARALQLRGAHFQDIEVVRERGEAPQLRFHGRAAEAAQRLGVRLAALTLTHDPSCCIGQVVLEGGP